MADLDYFGFDCYRRLDDLAAEAAAVIAVLQKLVSVVGRFGIDCYYFLGFDSDNFS